MAKKQFQTLVLTREDIEQVFNIRKSLSAVEDAFCQYALGKASMPSKVYLNLERQNGDFRAMPAYLDEQECCTLKWVNVHPDNPPLGLPMVMAVLVLNDARTGFPLAIMDGTYITSIRTGAAGAVAAKYLSPESSTSVALVGCGVQARMQLQMLRQVRRIQDVRVWGHLPKLSTEFVGAMTRRGERMEAAQTVKDAVSQADIIVTTTPVRKPLVKAGWVRKGAHINAIGADAAGKQELDIALLQEGCVVIDDWDQASHSGEINVALRKGKLSRKGIHATLGDIIVGRKKMAKRSRKITVFDSTGLAIQDAAIAQLIYTAARRKKVGQQIQLF